MQMSETEKVIKMLFFVAYSHSYGTDVCAYPSEDIAYKGACKIIADWFHDLEDLYLEEDNRLDELRRLINSGSYFAAVVLWNQISVDCDFQESITVDCSELITEVETPFVNWQSTDQEKDSD